MNSTDRLDPILSSVRTAASDTTIRASRQTSTHSTNPKADMDFTFEKWLEQEQPAGCVADMQRGWNACAAAIHAKHTDVAWLGGLSNYSLSDALRDAPRLARTVPTNVGLPDEPGWYVCVDQYEWFRLRWFDGSRFSIDCTQLDAKQGLLNRRARTHTRLTILGWFKPWWIPAQC